MSTISDRATVDVEINSQAAEQRLNKLTADAKKFNEALEKALSAGDKQAIKNNSKALNSVNKELRLLRSSAAIAASVMQRLDKASPRELKQTLKTLTKSLEYCKRGTEEWAKKVADIRKVKEALSEVNKALGSQESGWKKIASFYQNWYYSITSALSAITKGISGMQSAIQSYADMDSSMANTVKFTGMSADEVKQLNEAFKQMDTRTSREQLNELAAAAGRLGKNSVDDVLGFVRAGDQIAVAMDELGADAPQIISQLAGIFGLEASMGTEQAMLSVGSAINTLSQNCAASAPNLVDFASRMGAMANSTGMTMDEMLAFGSILDANRVSVEKSATAMQTVLNKMLADPAKFAKTAGMNVDEFTAALKRSSTEGLMMFIEQLSKLDSNGVSKTLADLSVSGSGVTTTFVTLANKIGDVKTQLGDAKTAFDDAKSVTEEFNTQNSTVQAELDKAKKGLNELAVTFGEKLAPMTLTAFSGMQKFVKGLISAIDFAASNKTAIIGLTAAVVAYTVAANAAAIKTAIQSAAMATSRALHSAWALAVTACKVVVTLFTGGVQAAKVAVEGLNATMRKNVFGLIASVIAIAVTAIIAFIEKVRDEAAAAEEARRKHQEYIKSLTDINTASADYAKNEITRLNMLYKAATDENRSKQERIESVKQLQAMYPAYFGNMSQEDIMLGKAKGSYDALTRSILQAAKAKAASAKIEENYSKIIELETTLDEQQKDYDKKSKTYLSAKGRFDTSVKAYRDSYKNNDSYDTYMEKYDAMGKAAEDKSAAYKDWSGINKTIHQTKRQLRELNKANDTLAKKYGANIADVQQGDNLVAQPTTPAASSSSSTSSKGGGATSGDKFASENSWAEEERLKNASEYSIGLKDYQQYCDRLDAIDKELLEKKLARQDLSTKERLDLLTTQINQERKEEQERAEEAEKAEADRVKAAVEAEKQAYATKQQELKGQYADGLLSEQAYKQALFNAEQEYLNKLKNIYAEGSKERADVERQIEDKLLNDKLDKQRKFVEMRNSIEKELSSGKEKAGQLSVGRSVLDSLVSSGELSGEEADAIYDKMRTQASEALQSIDKAMQSATPNTTKYAETVKKLNQELKDGIITEEEYAEAKRLAAKEGLTSMLGDSTIGQLLNLQSTWSSFMSVCKSDTEEWGEGLDGVIAKASAGAEALANVVSTGTSALSSMMSSATEFISANAQIEQAAIESRYSREIELAEGNSYKTKQLEKQRDEELAKSKNKASKKAFRMKVIEAVAQTAKNALFAVGAGLEAGYPAALWMIPLFTSIAAAQGAIQIALLKKQQKAADASGYAEGGFTRPGGKYEPAGIVHAGEWVASQELVKSPQARPLIDALEYAQRTNTIGSLRMADVQRISPTIVTQNVTASDSATKQSAMVNASLVAAIARLIRRLNEPFVTVNTVTGDAGIQQAQDEYAKLIRNKTPKSQWK